MGPYQNGKRAKYHPQFWTQELDKSFSSKMEWGFLSCSEVPQTHCHWLGHVSGRSPRCEPRGVLEAPRDPGEPTTPTPCSDLSGRGTGQRSVPTNGAHYSKWYLVVVWAQATLPWWPSLLPWCNKRWRYHRWRMVDRWRSCRWEWCSCWIMGVKVMRGTGTWY